ncbi:porin [soil metagenome]
MKLRIYTTLLVLLTAFTVKAQDAEQPIDTLTRHVAGIRQELDVLKRIKVSGYIQAQYQVADSGGVGSFAGGNFASGVDKRFMLRRARVKVQYDSPFNDKGISTSQYVFQVDVTERGVAIKDMYAKFTDPWCGWFSLTAGMQNRPFGYEIGYSSSLRESPERGRLSQIIFPNERDLGAMVSIQGPKTSNWNWLKIDAGLFNGTGGPGAANIVNGTASGSSNTSDFDKFKDFIGHIGINRSTKSEKIKWGLGASYYMGGYRQDASDRYKYGTDSVGVKGFMIDQKKADVSANINVRDRSMRNCFGIDAQLNIDWLIGLTTLRAEYIQGSQPGTSSTSVSAATVPSSSSTTYSSVTLVDSNGVATTTTTATTSTIIADTYIRNFNGAYFYFIQNIGHSPFQFIAKYDWYDANTDVEGDEIGVKAFSNSKYSTNAIDLKYTTLGLGLAYRWDAAVKLTAYWDQVTNETSEKLANYTKDLKDNVFTLRLQIKF